MAQCNKAAIRADMCSAKAAGFIHTAARHGQGAARYCSWCRQSSSGHPKEPPSPEPALTAAVNSGESAGAFCAPIATPHAEPPLNGVYGLPKVTQGLSERAALSALKGLWPSGARWQRPRRKAKRVGRRVCCPSEMRGFAFFGPVGARPLVKRKSDVDPHQRGRVCSPHVSRQSQ